MDESGVSPVIAVILMVAIVVALTAFLYGWVAGLDPGEPLPTARISIRFGGDEVRLRHDGGDALGAGGTDVVVETAGDLARHRVADLNGTWDRADPARWESGELVCVSCEHRGDELREISVVVQGRVFEVWRGTHQVPP